jgi:hypothetical protein
MQRSFLITGIAIYFAVLLNVFGNVQIGDTADQVEQTMGAPASRGKVGDLETLNYKNGTKITLKNGVVTDVSVRGQITIGTVTKVIGTHPPAPSSGKISARELTNQVAAASAKKTQPTPAEADGKGPASTQTKITAATNPATGVANATSGKAVAGNSFTKDAGKFANGANAFVAGFLIIFAVLSLALYVFFSFCFKLICEKAGHTPGALIWIPIAQFIPLLRVAKMREWLLVLMFVPMVNCVFALMLWAKICAARNKSPWLAALLLIPLANFFLIPYLAFSAANEQLDDATPADAHAMPPTDSAEKKLPDQTEDEPPVPADSEETVPEQPAIAS